MGVVCWSRVLVSSPGVGVGVRVCLARQLWALSLGSHRRTVLRKGWGAARRAGQRSIALLQTSQSESVTALCYFGLFYSLPVRTTAVSRVLAPFYSVLPPSCPGAASVGCVSRLLCSSPQHRRRLGLGSSPSLCSGSRRRAFTFSSLSFFLNLRTVLCGGLCASVQRQLLARAKQA